MVTGIEMFRKIMDEAQAGTTVGSCCAVLRRTRSSAVG